MFSGRCFFVDHESGYININHKLAIKYTETVKVKLIFEIVVQIQIVEINGKHTYNGVFNDS